MRCRALLIATGLQLAAAPGWSAVQVWQVGEGGLSWASQGEIAAALDLSGPGFIQPSGFAPQDNIAAALNWQDGPPEDFSREGQARVWDNAAVKVSDLVTVDGDRATSTGGRFKEPGVNQTGRIFFFDLGASFPVNRIVFYPSREGEADFVRAFEVAISDGRSFSQDGRPVYEVIRRVEVTAESRAQIGFEQQLLRFISLRILAPNPFEIAELEVYGEGFVPRAQYLSRFIDFGAPVNLGSLRLETEQVGSGGEGAAVTLELRNGTDETPLVYHRLDPETQSESELSAAAYASLSALERGPIRYDTANWSPWSTPFEAGATSALDLEFLPGPRRYFQFKLSFAGTAVQVMRVRRLGLSYAVPLAQRTRAEVALGDEPDPPGGVATALTGRAAQFIYGVRAEFGGGEFAGFDGVHIETPAQPAFLWLRLGEPPRQVAPDSVRQDETGLWVYFSGDRVKAANNAPVWIAFETIPLLYNTLFRGWLLDAEGGLPQPLEEGDAGPQLGTNSLRVFGSLGEPLSRFALSFGRLTPNGDGRNDEVEISYDLVFLLEEAEVELAIYDLAGRRLRQVFSGGQAAGQYAQTWDGRDEAGEMVSPGHYLCRLVVATQTERFEQTRPLAVIY
ncbi:MAG: hypothetical protein HYW07_17480 [Candidatus Latescibacteria bacterium]|nr:hypothetical protein [Candidatus Latescibacterota bacterium]